MGEIPVGIVIVTRAVALRQSSWNPAVHLAAGGRGAVVLSPPWLACAAALVPLIVTAMTLATIT